MRQQPHDHFYWINALRAVATISVIFLHTAADSLYQFTPNPGTLWWVGNCYDSLVRFCVPVFVMITGTLLLPLREPVPDFYKKRLLLIVFPFISWSLLYLLLNYSLARFHHTPVNWPWFIAQFWDNISYHLWYIYMIIGMYLVMPLISWLLVRAHKNQLIIFFIIWAITLRFNIYPQHSFIGYIGYLVLGYYLRTKVFVDARKTNWLAAILFSSGVLVTLVGTYLASQAKAQFEERFYDYLSLNVLMASVGVFLLAKNYFGTRPPVKFLSLVNTHSYGIYLCHVMILFFMAKAGLTYQFIHPLIAIPLVAVFCLLISLGLTLIIKKLPGGHYISG